MFSCLNSLAKTDVNVWENSRADQRKPEMQFSLFKICLKAILRPNHLTRTTIGVFFLFSYEKKRAKSCSVEAGTSHLLQMVQNCQSFCFEKVENAVSHRGSINLIKAMSKATGPALNTRAF